MHVSLPVPKSWCSFAWVTWLRASDGFSETHMEIVASAQLATGVKWDNTATAQAVPCMFYHAEHGRCFKSMKDPPLLVLKDFLLRLALLCLLLHGSFLWLRLVRAGEGWFPLHAAFSPQFNAPQFRVLFHGTEEICRRYPGHWRSLVFLPPCFSEATCSFYLCQD